MAQPQRAPEFTAADPNAPTAVEYAIIAVLLTAVAVGTWKTFGAPPPVDDGIPAASALP